MCRTDGTGEKRRTHHHHHHHHKKQQPQNVSITTATIIVRKDRIIRILEVLESSSTVSNAKGRFGSSTHSPKVPRIRKENSRTRPVQKAVY